MRLGRKTKSAPLKLGSEVEEHRAEVVLFSSAVAPEDRLLPISSIEVVNDAVFNGARAVELYRLSLAGQTLPGLEGQKDKIVQPSWDTRRWGLNTAARILGGNTARWDNMPWTALKRRHGMALRSALAARYAPATANRILGAVRSVLEEAYNNEWYAREDLERIKSVPGIAGSRLPPGRLLEPEEVTGLLTRCHTETTLRGARDSALFAVLYGCGLRRAEAAGLLRENLEHSHLTVIGKGNKERKVPFAQVASALVRWKQTRGDSTGPFLCRIHRWGGILRKFGEDRSVPKEQRPYAGLQPGGVWEITWRRSVEFEMTPFTPHDLRRSYITHLLDGGADVVAVQKLVGHSDPMTTAGYDRRPEERLREIAATLPFPVLE